ncbi:MAG TPA: MerR family transcriptional regulator [Thermomicrobiales bacterium]|jgi:DNA-binding transcriptional MerR regulator|nr:MerR family transcriptional regulator [Thermomicrobiales bacterium]
MLTIGQLARLGGTTVRAVRHYHQTGLLPEPPRLANGYRQYRASDLDRLIRIRQLSELGLSLADVRRLLSATPEERREALQALDAQYAAEQQTLEARRERIAHLLVTPGDPTVPAPYRAQQGSLAEMGVPGALIDLDSALYRTIRAMTPLDDNATIDQALAGLSADPATTLITADFMHRLDAIAPLAPDDPAIDELVRDYVAFLRATWPDLLETIDADGPDNPMATWAINDLMAEHLMPAQVSAIQRVMAELVASRDAPRQD